jgi:hypothetical protein
MSLASSLRSFVPLVIGLVVGGIGVSLFSDSLTGEEGSPEARVARLEVELKRAENRLAAFEGKSGRREGRTLGDGMRDIGDDLREGRPVTPDDVLRATQPLLRDLAPLFDRMRVRQQTRMIDSMTGELARKYDLSTAQQESLKVWFGQKAEEQAKAWSDLVGQEGVTVEDLARASREVRADDGLDQFMATTLSGDKLEDFKAERLAERAGRVQQEADMKVQRLDSMVVLDDQQRDQVFGIMARSSPDYDPAMTLEGIGGQIGATPGGDRQQAILSVLRPEQRVAYEAVRQQRRAEAAEEMEMIGLSLPLSWDLLDDFD